MNGFVPRKRDRVATTDRETFATPCWRDSHAALAPFGEISLYARGSALFDEICELPEYYLTRTETAILRGAARGDREPCGPQERA